MDESVRVLNVYCDSKYSVGADRESIGTPHETCQ